MTLLATASMTLTKTQLMRSKLGRHTSNNYFLARSGAEKVVDTMNKEIAIELPRLMKEANKAAHEKLLAGTLDQEGFIYQYKEIEQGQTIDPYSGQYMGKDYTNQYKTKLKELIYDHIITEFIKGQRAGDSYRVFSDSRNNTPIQIRCKIYHNFSAKNIGVPDYLKTMVKELAIEGDVGISKEKDAFVVEVTAEATEKNKKKSLGKSRVIGTIALEEFLVNNLPVADHLILEEYQWIRDITGKPTAYPEALQAGITSFNDLEEHIDLTIFKENYDWLYNNPILVITGSEYIDIEVDISNLDGYSGITEIPTAIVCTNSKATITLKATNEAKQNFEGIIVTAGQLKIISDMTINGSIIGDIEMLAEDVRINDDEDMLFKIRFMEKSLQRKLFDTLKITNYGEANSEMKVNNGMIQLSPNAIIRSEKGGLKFVMSSLRKL